MLKITKREQFSQLQNMPNFTNVVFHRPGHSPEKRMIFQCKKCKHPYTWIGPWWNADEYSGDNHYTSINVGSCDPRTCEICDESFINYNHKTVKIRGPIFYDEDSELIICNACTKAVETSTIILQARRLRLSRFHYNIGIALMLILLFITMLWIWL